MALVIAGSSPVGPPMIRKIKRQLAYRKLRKQLVHKGLLLADAWYLLRVAKDNRGAKQLADKIIKLDKKVNKIENKMWPINRLWP